MPVFAFFIRTESDFADDLWQIFEVNGGDEVGSFSVNLEGFLLL